MTLQTRHTEQQFRQTGKFKPINELHHSPTANNRTKFAIQSYQRVTPYSQLSLGEGVRLFRVYLDQPTSSSTEESIMQVILAAFKSLDVSGNLGEGGELFMNVNGVLVERMREKGEKFCISQMDYGCAIVRMAQNEPKGLLDLYVFEGRPLSECEFSQQISIKLRAEPDSFFLLQRGRILYIVKSLLQNYPMLQLNENNLEQSCADVERQSVLIKNLSARIIAVKFQEDNYTKSNEPLVINVPNRDVFGQILFKINRIKYHSYRMEEKDIKDWQSFDNNKPHKKQIKSTSDKAKLKPNKVSILSTNAVEDSKQSQKKKITLINQPRHLKISQRVATNTKQSNLVPSEADYAVSVKDQKEKETPYYDEFQNLLYEEEGGQEKQLALNDSFQQFEKKQHSEKNLEIIKELNKRREKETEEKRMLDSLKQKIKALIAEEKAWINKNFQLKADIKRVKNPESTEQIKEIDQIKLKIVEMKAQERTLIDELAEIKKNNCIQTLVFGEGVPQESSRSQRNKDKIFHSINSLPLQSTHLYNPLTTSVRSNHATSKFPTPINPQMPAPQGPPLAHHHIGFKQSYRPNFPMYSPPPSPINLYSSIPTQNPIQHAYTPVGQSKPSPILTSSNEYCSFPRPNAPNHQHSVAFTSAIFASGGRMAMGSPLGAKKASYQVFPAASGNKN